MLYCCVKVIKAPAFFERISSEQGGRNAKYLMPRYDTQVSRRLRRPCSDFTNPKGTGRQRLRSTQDRSFRSCCFS